MTDAVVERAQPAVRVPPASHWPDQPGELPPVRVEPAARARIRAMRLAAGDLLAVLDDDPTGSQTVHDVDVVTVLDPAEFEAGLTGAAACFVLTNSRALAEPAAVRLNREIAGELFRIGRRRGSPVHLVSRSDSTLRGHVLAEAAALNEARTEALGSGYDGILLVPAFIEAGRVTAADVHWARVDGRFVPAGDTEFARDATFGYHCSDLREFLAERSLGAVAAGEVVSIGLDDIRLGGPDRVAEILAGVRGGGWIVVNALDYHDLDVVVLGLLAAEAAGQAFLYRTGPSFVQALAGLEPQPPLTAEQLWPAGPPAGHGLVVVGSHVSQTTEQVRRARAALELAVVELDAGTAASPDRAVRQAHIEEVARQLAGCLAERDTLLLTSRTLLRGTDSGDSLRVAKQVSDAVSEVVRRARSAGPAWVVTKGGITSHDVSVDGLGIRRARVLGQLLPGLISVLRPLVAAPEMVGVPWVVFAGNVGEPDMLTRVIQQIRAER